MSNLNSPERFLARIDVRSLDECWPFIGSTFKNGYGELDYQRKRVKAHRVAFNILRAPIPLNAPKNLKGGGFVLHECDVRNCCNPLHLELGTYQQNRADSAKRKRIPNMKDFCGETWHAKK